MNSFRVSVPVFALTAELAAQKRHRDFRGVDETMDQYDAFLLEPGLGPATYLTSDGRVVWDDDGLWGVIGTRAEAFEAAGARTDLSDMPVVVPRRVRGRPRHASRHSPVPDTIES